jgi:rare lipoprotein A (peptidoglycan hydrolase)
MRAYEVNGIRYYPKKERLDSTFRGIASWYGEKYHGRKTANGEVYNMYSLTAAHKTLPMNTMLLVKNLETEKEVMVRVNDRGPFIGDRVIDLSKQAAEKIGMLQNGTSLVEFKILGYDGKVEVTVKKEKPVEEKRVVIKPILTPPPKKPVERVSETVVVEPMGLQESGSSIDIELIESEEPVEVEKVAHPVAVNRASIESPITETTIEDNIPTIVVKKPEKKEVIEEVEPIEPIEPMPIEEIVEEPKLIREVIKKSPVEADDGRFHYVQVSSFREPSGAKLYIDKHSPQLETPLKLISVEINGLFKVWVAGFRSRIEATDFARNNGYFPKGSYAITKEESVE